MPAGNARQFAPGGRGRAGSLPGNLPRVQLGGARALQHGLGLLRPPCARPPPFRPVLGGRGRRHRGLHLLGPATAGQPPVQRVARAGGQTRRSHRHHPAATPRNRRRPHRLLPDGGGGHALVGLVRSGRTRVPAAKQRNHRRPGRSRVPAQSVAHPRPPARAEARDRRGRCARVGHARLGDAARKGGAQVRLPRHPGRRTCAAGLHQRHHRPAQRGAEAAAGVDRQPAGIFAFARYVSADGRFVLVARRLGLDRRADGCAAADPVSRLSPARLPRTLRSGKSVSPDGKVCGAKHFPVSDCAENDDEGGAGAAATLRSGAAFDHERRRIRGRDRVRLEPGNARRHHQRNVRPDRNQLHSAIRTPCGRPSPARSGGLIRGTKWRSSTTTGSR